MRCGEVTGEPVGRDRMAVATVRGPGAARQGCQSPKARAAHQPLDPGAADPASVATQHGVDARRAIGPVALGMDQPDVFA